MITYNDVNKGLAEVVEYLNSIEDVWNKTRTLKLYDVSYHAGEIIDKYPLVKAEYDNCDLFNMFCNNSYNDFESWLSEDGKTDCREYIGRTSSFYLTNIHDERIDYVLSNLIDCTTNGYYSVDFDDSCKMVHFTDTDYYTEAELIEEYQRDMEYFADGSFLKDVKEYMSDAIWIAKYIDDFMENQIDNFTEWIECLNSNIEYQAELEAEEEKTFTAKYAKAINDLTNAVEQVVKETGCTLSDLNRIMDKARPVTA